MPDLPLMVACVTALFGSGLFAYRYHRQGDYAHEGHHQEAVFLLGFIAALMLLSVLAETTLAF